MRIERWSRRLLAAAPLLVCFLAGCGDFWEAPTTTSSTSFTLSNSGNISVAPGATSGDVTITVIPGSSFTGTVTLSCAVTSAPTGATSSEYPGCNFSSSSLTFSSATAQTSTFTATAASNTPLGGYDITINGVSSGVAASTSFCVEVSASGTGACTTAATASGNFYILNSDSIDGYSINSSALNALSGSPAALPSGVTGYSMAVDPTGHFLYVGTSGGILLYNIGSGGALTLNTSWSNPDITAFALQVDSTGQWLLDASNTGPTLYAWPISTTTGLSTLANGVSVPSVQLVSGGSVGLGGMAISPDKNLVAVAAGSATQTFTFQAGSGNTGATSPFTGTVYTTNALGVAVSVAFDPDTRFLYIGETAVPAFSSSATNSGGLRMISIASDVPGNDVSGSPYQSGGTGPHAILAASNGYVYVANSVETSAGNVTPFLLNASTPSLNVQTDSASTGEDPVAITKDSTGDFVLVVNNLGTTPFDAFTFDATTTGQLDAVSLTGSVGTGPVAIVAVP